MHLRWWLQQRNFTDGAIREFIPTFKDSIGYAGLLAPEKTGGNEDVEELDDGGASAISAGQRSAVQNAPTPGVRLEWQVPSGLSSTVIPILLPSLGQVGALQLPTRMTEAEWTMMMAIIGAYKPTIVQDAEGRNARAPVESDRTS